jgi:GT2 family glycosyltransferase
MEPVEHVVVIASTGRPAVLAETLKSLDAQTRPADIVVLSIVNPQDVPPDLRESDRLRVIRSEIGSTTQRNTAVASLATVPRYITFIDDDLELAPDFLENARRFMDRSPDVALMGGLLVADGIHAGEIDRVSARKLLQDARGSEVARDSPNGYGCNMTVRGAVAVAEPFDERMRLYALHEDVDFSVRCRRHGRVVHYHNCLAVHLAVGSGRIGGRQYGFAQIVNPFYLWRKGTMASTELLRLWAHAIGANTVKATARIDRPDRRGRLAGNALGFKEVIWHGGRPEAIEALATHAPR